MEAIVDYRTGQVLIANLLQSRPQSMSKDHEIETTSTNWKSKTILAGMAIGALVGAGTAILLVQRAEREQSTVKVGTGEGIKLGMILLGMLRQIAQLGDGD